VYCKDIIRNTINCVRNLPTKYAHKLLSALHRNDLDPYQQRIINTKTHSTMVTTRSASKRKLDLLEAAPLIRANERARAARASNNANGERVRKQRSHAIPPQEDQPVSARLRSSTRKKQEVESFVKTRQSVGKVKKQDVDLELYEPLLLNQRDHLRDAETPYEKVWRKSTTRRRKSWLIQLSFFSTRKNTLVDASRIIYSIIKTTQLPTSENDCEEPKERKSVSFRDPRALVDEVIFHRDDPPERITQPDLYQMPSCPVENKLPSSSCKEQKQRKSVAFRYESLVAKVFYNRDDFMEPFTEELVYGVLSPVIKEERQLCVEAIYCTSEPSETVPDHAPVTEALVSRDDLSEPSITDSNDSRPPSITARTEDNDSRSPSITALTEDMLNGKTVFSILGMAFVAAYLVEYFYL
jgi:hypothetical protein